GQERAGRQREDQQDQVDLLDQSSDQEQEADDEIDEALPSQDRALRRPEGTQHSPGEPPQPAGLVRETRSLLDAHPPSPSCPRKPPPPGAFGPLTSAHGCDPQYHE